MKDIDIKAINKYINDSFLRISRSMGFYGNINFMFNYVIIQNESLKYSYMLLLHDRFDVCPYEKVVSELFYNLHMEFFKKFGIIYQPLLSKTHENMNGDEVNNEISTSVELNSSIVDMNYIVAMIEMLLPSSRRNIMARLSVIPEYWDQIDPNKYIQLLMKYHSISYEEYCALDKDDPKHHLPDKYYKWEGYLDLYQRTFNRKPWDGYQFIFSSVDDPIATFKVLDPPSENDSENKEE